VVEEPTWPRFTLLGQSLGSMYLAWEAMSKFIPDVYIGTCLFFHSPPILIHEPTPTDSMGYAFTYLVVSLLAHIPIGAYVHYPTISTDMLARVRCRQAWHTNANHISRSALLSHLKLTQVNLLSAHHNAITYLALAFFTDRYYRLFMYHYAISLRTASILMVNSTWTKNHVDAILCHSDFLLDLTYLTPPFLFLKLLLTRNSAPDKSMIVYPPCDTREMEKFSLMPRERIILSVAQFRSVQFWT